MDWFACMAAAGLAFVAGTFPARAAEEITLPSWEVSWGRDYVALGVSDDGSAVMYQGFTKNDLAEEAGNAWDGRSVIVTYTDYRDGWRTGSGWLFRSDRTVYEFDCERGLLRVIEAEWWEEPRMMGRSRVLSPAPAPWREASGRTLERRPFKSACKHFPDDPE